MRLSLSRLTNFNPFPHLKLFDVTMKDGLQSIPKIYTIDEKKIILKRIMNVYKPYSLEIGSIVSSNIVPQMKYSYKLYNYANSLYNKTNPTTKLQENQNQNQNKKKCNFYLSVPPTTKYLDIAKQLNIKNISLTTSVSNPFQLKMSNQTIQETKDIIKDSLKTSNPFDNVKLYVSCITNCPIKGKIDNDHIINELYEYLHIDGISEVCLTDTCGNIRYSDFIHIIDYLNIEMNYKLNKLSLHLHYNNERNYYTIDNIINYAINNNIYKFDVTSFENIYFGNGYITIDLKKFNNNLTYDRLYESIYNNFN